MFALEDGAHSRSVKLSQISRTSMFQGKEEKHAYQRVTRLSKPYPGQIQLGAVATGEAKAAEILLFDTSATTTPVSRGALYSNKEAVDVDVIQVGDGEYMFAYADVHDIYIKKITRKLDSEEPECVYITPASRSEESGVRPSVPSFRSLRWLTKDLICMLTNIASSGGVVIQIFRTPPDGKGQCRLAQSVRLPESIKKATGMAVANLTPPVTSEAAQGYTQFVIAVAGQSSSISLFKVDLQVEGAASMVSGIKAFRTFKQVHPAVITSLAFSNFTPPTEKVTAHTPQQVLKLASTGVSNTVVVHTLPLFPVPLSVSRGQSETPRYVVALPSKAAAGGIMAFISFIGILLVAILIQSFAEIRGAPRYIGARDYIPSHWQEFIGRPYSFPPDYKPLSTLAVATDNGAGQSIIGEAEETSEATSAIASHATGAAEGLADVSSMIASYASDASEALAEATSTIASQATDASSNLADNIAEATQIASHHANSAKNKFWDRLRQGATNGQYVLNSVGDDVKVKLHEGQEHGGKQWEDLAGGQKKEWKRRLKDAGHWAEDVPTTVFKGVLFGEIAGAVGRAVAGG